MFMFSACYLFTCYKSLLPFPILIPLHSYWRRPLMLLKHYSCFKTQTCQLWHCYRKGAESTYKNNLRLKFFQTTKHLMHFFDELSAGFGQRRYQRCDLESASQSEFTLNHVVFIVWNFLVRNAHVLLETSFQKWGWCYELSAYFWCLLRDFIYISCTRQSGWHLYICRSLLNSSVFRPILPHTFFSRGHCMQYH